MQSPGYSQLDPRLAQPYLMGSSKVRKPAQLLDKDPAELSRMMQLLSCGRPLLILISPRCIPVGLLITVQLGDICLMGNFLWIIYTRSIALKLPQESPEHATPPTFREKSLLEIVPYALGIVIQIKTPEVSLWGSDSKILLYLFRSRNQITRTK